MSASGITLNITLPMPANVTNGRLHWTTAHRVKKSYAKRLDELQCAGLIPPPPRVPFLRASIESTMVLGAAMDDDNAMARHKPALDWLKTRGYIADDRRKNLRWVGLPLQVVTRRMEARIDLVLTEL